MKSITGINSLFLRQKTISKLPDIQSPLARVLSVLLLLLPGACTMVPVNNDQPPTTTRLEVQQKIFDQAKALFLNQQYTQAARDLLPLAQQGHINAQYIIGYMYHYGYGLPRNERESVRWIAMAAARGHPQAKTALARINASHNQRGVLAEPIQILK